MRLLRRLISLMLVLTMVLGAVGARAEKETPPEITCTVGDAMIERNGAIINVSIPIEIECPSYDFVYDIECTVYTDTMGVHETWEGSMHERGLHVDTTCVVKIPWVPGPNPYKYHVLIESPNMILYYDDYHYSFSYECDHVADDEAVYLRTEYYPYTKGYHGKEKYETVHNRIDVYQATCKKCGKVFQSYLNSRDEEHLGEVCICGYVQPGHNVIESVTFLPLGGCCVGEEFRLLVQTSDIVETLTAVNNEGVSLNKEWKRIDTTWKRTGEGDGTALWEVVYKADVPANARTWTIKAYSATNKYLGTKVTNPLTITLQPIESQEARWTRCQDAMLKWAVLSKGTMDTTQAYSAEIGTAFTANRMWHYIAGMALYEAGDVGLTLYNAVVNTWANMGESLLNLLTLQFAEFGYTEEKLDKITKSIWRAQILDMLNNNAVENNDTANETAAVLMSDTLAEVIDATYKEEAEALTKWADDLAILFEEYFGKTDVDFVKDLRSEAKTYGDVVKISDACGYLLDYVSVAIKSVEAANEVSTLKNEYSKLCQDYNRSVQELNKLKQDAQEMGNEQLVEVIDEMLKDLKQQRLDNELRIVKIVYDIMKFMKNNDIHNAAASAALKEIIGMGLTEGPLALGIVELIAKWTQTVTNLDETYVAAANLYVLYAMSRSMEIANVENYNDCKFNYRTFELMARIHAAGCDAAIEFVKAHRGLGIDMEVLGLESEQDMNNLIQMLQAEKQIFLNYANSLK
ncbi:MAG: hypothetical protein IJZ74_04485 [Clostridia bacterium]|nr:hypothetical protein [Clostridia bacterium]